MINEDGPVCSQLQPLRKSSPQLGRGPQSLGRLGSKREPQGGTLQLTQAQNISSAKSWAYLGGRVGQPQERIWKRDLAAKGMPNTKSETSCFYSPGWRLYSSPMRSRDSYYRARPNVPMYMHPQNSLWSLL
ncbi:serine/threonine-protein kinase PAK 6 [Lates japonicus]|uniref:Serine/threonine-protein kinase PAK 6 n=1 Tax=Lates japonicus TaxID=270547 RepID=A0AAD3RL69_LATJO|nr:serine/threonine-protein kinase PAK 6 [Lates japonicus]